MPGPGLLLLLLLGAAVALYLLRRLEPLAALLAAVLTGGLAVTLAQMPLSTPARVAGRIVWLGQPVVLLDLQLAITPATRALLVFLFGVAALSAILAWRTYQGRTFYPFMLGLLLLWGVAALMHPLAYAPFPLALAAALAVFLIQAGKVGDTRGAWRQLLFPSLAVPLFLVATWYIDQAPLNPDDVRSYQVAGWLLIAGFVLLLQPAPLHVAMPAVARQSPPVVAAFLWIGGQATTLFLLQRFLVTYPWLADAVDSARWLLWLGVLTAVTGGVMSAVHDRLGHFTGYAAVYDYGVLLVAMALRGTAGLPMAIWLLLTRSLALLTLAGGAAMIRHHMESDELRRIRGAVSRLPWSVAALVSGGFALAGMPLTAQFASRWAMMQLVTEIDVRWTLLLLVGRIGVLVGAIRAGQACLGTLRDSPVEREPLTMAFLLVALIVAGVLLGLFPQLLASPVAAVILPLSALGAVRDR